MTTKAERIEQDRASLRESIRRAFEEAEHIALRTAEQIRDEMPRRVERMVDAAIRKMVFASLGFTDWNGSELSVQTVNGRAGPVVDAIAARAKAKLDEALPGWLEAELPKIGAGAAVRAAVQKQYEYAYQNALRERVHEIVKERARIDAEAVIKDMMREIEAVLDARHRLGDDPAARTTAVFGSEVGTPR